MKKKNILIKILIVCLIIFPLEIHAATNCGKITNSTECKEKGCNWGYNGSSEKYCYNNASSITNSSTNTKGDLNFCQSTAVIWQIVGWVFLIVKIVIPILLIIFGVLDFSKCVMGGKDDELPKALKRLAFRAISAVVVFFIPTIVSLVMGLIANFGESGAKEDFQYCQTCILTPRKCDTSKDVGKQ